ncbi:H/ACA ribonucleoprotein complex subunit 2-like protein [Lingula anatina]|uniref:H/ACA ribonucleoprotein complex subunit 2 n=1 Tax=Lingula anatina TaxID=7574 RepID=A0A1S3J9L0_LINAN|nr:H/ACA ribonucleoprotein complex subunit 2-like protein [Lingula anatina]|eukprot:XP_013407087.1 H/ACA ribonucleoprotein complex subunit 2-like protein [Lingula anatina]
MGKDKKEKRKSEGEDIDKEKNYEDLAQNVSPIAKPLASRKMAKKLYKIIKKAQKQKQLRKGVKEVQKFVRKGEKGVIVFAGDTSPVDVICHMPLVCEESNIPYCYTPSKEDLGAACGSRRPTCMVMVKPHEDYNDLYQELFNEVKGLPLPL